MSEPQVTPAALPQVMPDGSAVPNGWTLCISQYGSKCVYCRERIVVGQSMLWRPGKGCHPRCYTPTAVAGGKPQISPDSLVDGALGAGHRDMPCGYYKQVGGKLNGKVMIYYYAEGDRWEAFAFVHKNGVVSVWKRFSMEPFLTVVKCMQQIG
jgi:hypothetical protein